MITRYDIAYWLGLGVTAPVWLLIPKARRKVFKAFRERDGRVTPPPTVPAVPSVMIHAVSLGEMNATPALVDHLRRRLPELRFVISTTTDVGYDAAVRHYGKQPDVTLIRYPLDYSLAVRRTLDLMQPTVAVLLELEVWPNFVRECEQRNIPVVIANGRISGRSFPSYRRVRFLVAPMFRRLSFVGVQEATYADRFIRLGVPADRVEVTGIMKFDSATLAEQIDGAADLGRSLGLRPGEELIWVCGSTGPGEEEAALRIYASLRSKFPRLRLVIVPRQPGRFDEVADMIRRANLPLLRQSRPDAAPADASPVVLGDALGHLRKFYSIADVIFVGRSLVDLGSKQHGSDMIEAAALAKPVVVGPFTGNFAEAMNRLIEADAIRIAQTESDLGDKLAQLLSDPQAAKGMAQRAQQVVRDQQGATARNAEKILEHLHVARGSRTSA